MWGNVTKDIKVFASSSVCKRTFAKDQRRMAAAQYQHTRAQFPVSRLSRATCDPGVYIPSHSKVVGQAPLRNSRTRLTSSAGRSVTVAGILKYTRVNDPLPTKALGLTGATRGLGGGENGR